MCTIGFCQGEFGGVNCEPVLFLDCGFFTVILSLSLSLSLSLYIYIYIYILHYQLWVAKAPRLRLLGEENSEGRQPTGRRE
jgi:hypothetical protein